MLRRGRQSSWETGNNLVFTHCSYCICKPVLHNSLDFSVLRATLDLNLRHVNLEKKTTHDVHSRKVREKDRDLRNLKKAELQLKVAMDSINHIQLIHEKVKGQVSVAAEILISQVLVTSISFSIYLSLLPTRLNRIQKMMELYKTRGRTCRRKWNRPKELSLSRYRTFWHHLIIINLWETQSVPSPIIRTPWRLLKLWKLSRALQRKRGCCMNKVTSELRLLNSPG